jgi:predicted SAM-dependent methyltransferase
MLKEDTACPLCYGEGQHVRDLQELLIGTGDGFEQRICRSCGIYFLSPRIREIDIDHYYPPDYIGYLQDLHPPWIRAITHWLGLDGRRRRMIERYVTGGRLLDVGVGNGFFLKTLDSKKWERFGIDTAWNPSDWQREEVVLYEGSFDKTPLPLHPLDAITMWHVFEHFYHPQQALANAHRLLKPGGFLFIVLPDLKNLDRHLFGRFWVGWDAPRHIAIYSSTALKQMLFQNGFELCAVHPSSYTGDYFLLNLEFLQRGMNRSPIRLSQSLFLRILLSPILWGIARIGLAPIKMYVAKKRI